MVCFEACVSVQARGLEWRDEGWNMLFTAMSGVGIQRAVFSVKASLVMGSEKEVKLELRNRQRVLRPQVAEFAANLEATTNRVMSFEEVWKCVPFFNTDNDELKGALGQLLSLVSTGVVPLLPVPLDGLQTM